MAVRKLIPLALLLVLTGCAALPASSPSTAAAPAAAPAAGPFELTLVHSNDTWGYLDPCG